MDDSETVLKEVIGASDIANIDLRTAALTIGLERLAQVTAQRGIWP